MKRREKSRMINFLLSFFNQFIHKVMVFLCCLPVCSLSCLVIDHCPGALVRDTFGKKSLSFALNALFLGNRPTRILMALCFHLENTMLYLLPLFLLLSLECLCPHNIYMLNPNMQCDGIWR